MKVYTPVNNRMESQYEVIQNDSTNDIIDFDGQKGIYPDSLTEDFALTKKMQRFEDYELSDNAAFWAGYHLGRDTWDWGWTWHSPWYYRTYGWAGMTPGMILGTMATTAGTIPGTMVTMAYMAPGAMATMATTTLAIPIIQRSIMAVLPVVTPLTACQAHRTTDG